MTNRHQTSPGERQHTSADVAPELVEPWDT